MTSPIPTASRDELPKSLSYPIGAREVSEILPAMDDVSFELRFRNRSVSRNAEWRALLASKGEIEILHVERPLHAERWVIGVYAVPSEERASARALLRSVAFPQVAVWLRQPQKHCFRARYHLGSRSLRVAPHVAGARPADDCWSSPQVVEVASATWTTRESSREHGGHPRRERQSVGGRNGMNRS